MNDLFPSLNDSFDTLLYSEKNFTLPDSEILLYTGYFNQLESDFYYKYLLNNIRWQQEQLKLYGKVYNVPRLTAWYGETDKSYTYSGIPMKPEPWNEQIGQIKEKVEKVAKVNFTSVLLNLYRNGSDSVSWHSDDEKELGINPIIGSVSFGETRTFQLKHKKQSKLKESLVLTHGSLVLMKGNTQHNWLHQIPKSSKPLRPRINLTFRIIM